LCIDQSFYLAIISVKAVGGGVHRILQPVHQSKIIDKKECYLIDLNNNNNKFCFFLAVHTELTGVRDLPNAELLSKAKELLNQMEWSLHRKVMLCEIQLSEDLLHVNICKVLLSDRKKDWGTFKTNISLRYPKICFILLHNEHYYGVKNIRNVFGMRCCFGFGLLLIVELVLHNGEKNLQLPHR